MTGLSHARNIVLVQSCEALIAISDSHGTLSEIALALKMWKPVIGLNIWPDIRDVHYNETPEKAVEKAFSLLPWMPVCSKRPEDMMRDVQVIYGQLLRL